MCTCNLQSNDAAPGDDISYVMEDFQRHKKDSANEWSDADLMGRYSAPPSVAESYRESVIHIKDIDLEENANNYYYPDSVTQESIGDADSALAATAATAAAVPAAVAVAVTVVSAVAVAVVVAVDVET